MIYPISANFGHSIGLENFLPLGLFNKKTYRASEPLIFEETTKKLVVNPRISTNTSIDLNDEQRAKRLADFQENIRKFSTLKQNIILPLNSRPPLRKSVALSPKLVMKMNSFSQFVDQVNRGVISKSCCETQSERKNNGNSLMNFPSKNSSRVIKDQPHLSYGGSSLLSSSDLCEEVSNITLSNSADLGDLKLKGLKQRTSDTIPDKDRVSVISSRTKKTEIKIQAPILQKIEKDNISDIHKLKNVLNEFYNTELSFYNDVVLVGNIYYKNSMEMQVFTNKEKHYLFQIVEPVLKLSNKLIYEMKEIIELIGFDKLDQSKYHTLMVQITNKICDVFTKLGNDYEDVYGSYFVDYNKSMKYLNRIQQTHLSTKSKNSNGLSTDLNTKNIKQFFNTCDQELRLCSTSWNLDSLLIKPIQRILKYPLFFKELREIFAFDLNNTHPNYNNIITNQKLFPVHESNRYTQLIKTIDQCTLIIDKVAKKNKAHNTFSTKSINRSSVSDTFNTVTKHLSIKKF